MLLGKQERRKKKTTTEKNHHSSTAVHNCRSRNGKTLVAPVRKAGASPTTALTHIAIQEALDGKVVEWMEKVSDQQDRG